MNITQVVLKQQVTIEKYEQIIETFNQACKNHRKDAKDLRQLLVSKDKQIRELEHKLRAQKDTTNTTKETS